MGKFKVEVDAEKCIGCGACTSVENSNFEMDGDKAKVIAAEVDDATASNAGKDVCPVEAITVEEMA